MEIERVSLPVKNERLTYFAATHAIRISRQTMFTHERCRNGISSAASVLLLRINNQCVICVYVHV